MEKAEIIKKLKENNSIEGRNSMGVSESNYNEFYLLNNFLMGKKIHAENLSEKELNLLLDLSEFAGEVFY